jgi:hypothetical protein
MARPSRLKGMDNIQPEEDSMRIRIELLHSRGTLLFGRKILPGSFQDWSLESSRVQRPRHRESLETISPSQRLISFYLALDIVSPALLGCIGLCVVELIEHRTFTSPRRSKCAS